MKTNKLFIYLSYFIHLSRLHLNTNSKLQVAVVLRWAMLHVQNEKFDRGKIERVDFSDPTHSFHTLV